MNSTLATAAAGSNCPSGGTDPSCTATVDVLIPGLTIVKTANTSVAEPGTVIGYTITVTDSGQTPYTGAVVTDDLTGVLGDAGYDSDAAATAGSVSYTSPTLTWTGNLSPGGTATITYSVTVNNPDTGGKLVVNTVTSSAVGSTCPPGTTSGSCQVTIPVLTPALTITKTASVATAVPGQTVTYTITVDNSGQTPYTGATVADDLTGVLGDAAYNGDASASAGSVSYAAPVPDLDREPVAGRLGHRHLLRHRRQPRHRRPRAHEHRHLVGGGQHLPAGQFQPVVLGDGDGGIAGDHERRECGDHDAGQRGQVHLDVHQHRPDALHRDHDLEQHHRRA